MGVRSALRLAMVLLAATVGLLIYAQWRTDAAPADGQDARPRPELPAGDRDVEAVTDTLTYSQSDNGRKTLRITADRQVDFSDGWKVWEGPEVWILGRDAERDDDDVHLVGDTMRTTGDDDRFTEVRIIGNVVADLPGGGVFDTRRIDYDAVTGVASNCNRNSLQYAGLLVHSDCLRFQTAADPRAGESLGAEELRMWKALSIEAAADSGEGLPPGLRGGAEELRFRPGGEQVTLTGDPSVSFDAAAIQAQELYLDVGPAARELRGIRAVGGARARIGEPAAEGRDSERVLTGDEIVLDFADGATLDRLAAQADEGGESRLRFPGQGSLSAPRIELLPGEDRQEVSAGGGVQWRGEMGGVRELQAADLELQVSAHGIEQLQAEGQVEALFEDAAGAQRRLTGPRLSVRWGEGEGDTPEDAEWPDGVALDDGGRSITAGSARLVAGVWVLSGDPRPRVEDPEVELAADSISVGADGELGASGAVEGRLSGSRLAAGGALFGQAASVQVHAGSATLAAEGQTRLHDSVQVVWESQSLLASSLMLDSEEGRLRAGGGVDLSAVVDPAAETPGFVTVTADDLLVEQDTAEIRVAGSTNMRLGEHQIAADRMAVAVDEGGAWSQVVAEGEVTLEQPGARATGERLEYTIRTGDLLLLGSEDRPATFVYDDLEYRSREALRVRWEGEDVIIESTEAGRTTTKVVKREDGAAVQM